VARWLRVRAACDEEGRGEERGDGDTGGSGSGAWGSMRQGEDRAAG
jgi:hypothetical protein